MQVVAKSRMLTPAFVYREICVFIATLADAYPGCKGTSKGDGASPDECRRKKWGATWKAYAFA
jgi:hypothetical protein